MFSNVLEPFVWYDETDNWKNLAITYYYIDPQDPKHKLWVRAPFDNDFMIVEPYTENDFISRHIQTSKGVKLFKLSFLRKISVTNVHKNSLLIALLWLKTHHQSIYDNKINQAHHEYYRCKDSTKEYLLIPLYAKMGYISKKNPVLLYHSSAFKNSLLIAIRDVYHNLVDMFGDYVLSTPIVMNGERRFLVQFNEYPASFVFRDINNMWW